VGAAFTKLKKNEKTRKGFNSLSDAASGVSSTSSSTKNTVQYRIKNAGGHGGYTLVNEEVGGDVSREEMLDMRGKKKSDRYC